MHFVGERWFAGNLQAALYNWGVLLWILSELGIFVLTGRSDQNGEKAKKADRLSFYAVFAGNIFCVLLALTGTDRLQVHIPGAVAWIGIVLLYAGVIFRVYAVATLRKFFSVTVKIKEGHKLIKSGPYAFLRHPAYTGSIASLLGMQLGVRSIGFLIVIVLILAVYGYRIHVEEAALMENFGEAYEEYKKQTKRILPFIY